MKFLHALIIASLITAYCDLQWRGHCGIHWREGYGSWNQCYEKHLSTKGPTTFLAIK